MNFHLLMFEFDPPTPQNHQKYHRTTFNLSSIFIFLFLIHVRGKRRKREKRIHKNLSSFNVCLHFGLRSISDKRWDEILRLVKCISKTYIYEPTHQKARMRIIFHWYVNIIRSLHRISTFNSSTQWTLKDDDDSEVCIYVCTYVSFNSHCYLFLTNTESDVEYWQYNMAKGVLYACHLSEGLFANDYGKLGFLRNL